MREPSDYSEVVSSASSAGKRCALRLVQVIIAMQPFDFVAVRMMSNAAYAGPVDCLLQTLRSEGPYPMRESRNPMRYAASARNEL